MFIPSDGPWSGYQMVAVTPMSVGKATHSLGGATAVSPRGGETTYREFLCWECVISINVLLANMHV